MIFFLEITDIWQKSRDSEPVSSVYTEEGLRTRACRNGLTRQRPSALVQLHGAVWLGEWTAGYDLEDMYYSRGP